MLAIALGALPASAAQCAKTHCARTASLPDSAITEFRIPTATEVRSLTAGPAGNVWFTGALLGGCCGIGRITPTGKVAEFPIQAASVTAGPDGNLWFIRNSGETFACCGKNKLTRMTPGGTITAGFPLPGAEEGADLATGPDGTSGSAAAKNTSTTSDGALRPAPSRCFPSPGREWSAAHRLQALTATCGFGR
jgi:streptogramin lyase